MIKISSGTSEFIRFNEENFVVNYFGSKDLPTYGVQISKSNDNSSEVQSKRSTVKVRVHGFQ